MLDSVLKRFIRRWTVLKRRDPLSGPLLAKGAGFLASGVVEHVEAQICVDGWTGNETFFPLVVVNRPTPSWGQGKTRKRKRLPEARAPNSLKIEKGILNTNPGNLLPGIQILRENPLGPGFQS